MNHLYRQSDLREQFLTCRITGLRSGIKSDFCLKIASPWHCSPMAECHWPLWNSSLSFSCWKLMP